MYRAFLVLAAALIFSCCAPMVRTSGVSLIDSGVYTVRVINQDWDSKAVRIYCDGRYVLIIRLVTGETQTKRLRETYCGSVRFQTIGLGGDVIYQSPDILMSAERDVEITLTEHPVHTHWRTGLISRKTSR